MKDYFDHADSPIEVERMGKDFKSTSEERPRFDWVLTNARANIGIVLSLWLLTTLVTAQERRIIGRVLDRDTKKPVVNAHVIILGTTEGTASNAGGYFEVKVDFSLYKTLVVSHVGFKTSEVQIPVEDRFMFYLDKERTVLREITLEDYPMPVDPPVVVSSKDSGDFGVVESGAVFPGGMDGFYRFIGNALQKNLTRKPTEIFSISFTIHSDGNARDISVSDTLVSATEVQNAFKEIPAWTPAQQRQGRVPQYFVLPVRPTKSIEARAGGLIFHMKRQIKYPLEASRLALEGTVHVRFTLESGKIVYVGILSDIGGDCGQAVIRALSSAPSEFLQPLGQGTFILPVNFYRGSSFEEGAKPIVTNEILLPNINIIILTLKK